MTIHKADSAQQVDHLLHDPSGGATPIFAVLDTLRAVGALAVVLTHVTFWTGDYFRYGIVGLMLPRLDVGVAIFFVLSGFLLSHQYLASAAAGCSHDGLRRYYWKRFLRIYPPYLIAVVLAMVFVRVDDEVTLSDWLTVLWMGDIYVSDALRAGQTQMWSLATEVSFYVVLPLLMWLAAAKGRLRPTTPRVMSMVLSLVAINVAWTLGLNSWAYDLEVGLPGQWLPSYLMWFAGGIALAWAHVLVTTDGPGVWLSRLVAIGRQPGVCWAVALSLLVVAATPLSGPALFDPSTPGEALTRQVLYALIGIALVLTGVFNDPDSAYTRSMSTRLLRRLGHISFGVFCIHLVVLHFVYWATPYTKFQGNDLLPVLGLTLLITLPLAELIYRFVERPMMRLRHVGSATPRTTPAKATRHRS